MPNRIIRLSRPARKAFAKPVNGRGGHQALIRRLQKQIDDKGNLTISDDDLDRMVRYAAYGTGGFQDRFNAASGRPRRRKMAKRVAKKR